MMKKMNKKILCLVIAACVFTAGISIKSALAYFTTYVVATGEEVLNLGFAKTTLEERIEGTNKTIKVANTGTADCYVRVKVLTISDSNLTGQIVVSEPEPLDNWTELTDGYYVYKSVLPANSLQKTTTELNIQVTPGANANDFDVIVIQESAPVLYDENGNTYAGWNSSDYILEKR